MMAFFARLEATCANVVERTFAVAFPSALEPVQIARKLVAAYESGAAASGRGGRRFVVRLSAADFARFERDLPYLERQWTTMLGRLVERSRRPERSPEVRAEAAAGVATGTVAILVDALPEAKRLSLRVRKGVPPQATMPLDRERVVGRDAACDLVLHDPRVSRRHVAIVPGNGGLLFRDLSSANGTRLNGVRLQAGALALGDVVALGDSELVVEAAQ